MSFIEQTNLFSSVIPKFKIDKKIRLIECFAGIGSQAKALTNLKTDFEYWKVIEFEPHAIDSYNAIHNTNFVPSDITTIHASDLEIRERESYTYILTYSFPCQDLSLAGKQRGMKKGESTRSGLLWEVERILDECHGELPQVLLMENVPQVIGKKNIKDFQMWRKKLEQLGYSNYVQILNAKDYGIPQNRKRCFMVSILGDYYYEFPRKQKLKLRLKDMLEDNVDEKYFLSDAMVDYFTYHTEEMKEKGCGFKFDPIDIERERESKSHSQHESNENRQHIHTNKCIQIGEQIGGDKYGNYDQSNRIYSTEGISPTQCSRYDSGSTGFKIAIDEEDKG